MFILPNLSHLPFLFAHYLSHSAFLKAQLRPSASSVNYIRSLSASQTLFNFASAKQEDAVTMFLSKASVLFVAYVCLVSLSTSKANELEGLEGLDAGNGAAPCPWTGPKCIDDCRGRPNGYYQWCLSCNTVAYCSSGQIHFLSCPPGTVWDDKRQQCNKTSTTCYCYEERETCNTTGPRCIRSCTGLEDGDYQSCHGCSVYASCVGGYLLYDYRPCAPAWPRPPLRWDDYAKKCLYNSRTCNCIRDNQPEGNELRWSQILKK